MRSGPLRLYCWYFCWSYCDIWLKLPCKISLSHTQFTTGMFHSLARLYLLPSGFLQINTELCRVKYGVSDAPDSSTICLTRVRSSPSKPDTDMICLDAGRCVPNVLGIGKWSASDGGCTCIRRIVSFSQYAVTQRFESRIACITTPCRWVRHKTCVTRGQYTVSTSPPWCWINFFHSGSSAAFDSLYSTI